MNGCRGRREPPLNGRCEDRLIKLTRINGEEFILNAEMIQYVEARPDTIITLSSKERVIVRESVDEVVRRIIDYGRALRTFPPDRM